MSDSVLVQRVEDGIAALTLNRPEKRNALNGELVAALKKALEQTAADPSVRVVTLRGAGKDFCAGADLGTHVRAENRDLHAVPEQVAPVVDVKLHPADPAQQSGV